MNAQPIAQPDSQILTLAQHALGWLRRQFSLDNATDRMRDLRVVERLAVGPKQYVVVVECAGERFLVGTSLHGVQTMARLNARAPASSYPAGRSGDL